MLFVCEPSAGCVNKTLFGRSYKVITTPRFTVMVSISNEGGYTRADVSITNHTDTPLNMTPEDFRVEVLTPKPKVLLYIPPANLVFLPPPAQLQHPSRGHPLLTRRRSLLRIPATAPATAGETTPSPNHRRRGPLRRGRTERPPRKLPKKPPPNNISRQPRSPPTKSPSGRVYFERDKKSHLVNVVLPIAGLVFEFPYAMKK